MRGCGSREGWRVDDVVVWLLVVGGFVLSESFVDGYVLECGFVHFCTVC